MDSASLFRVYEEVGEDGYRSSVALRGNDLIFIGSATRLRLRFERYVDRDPDPCGCWTWTGSLRSDGYGQLQLVKGITWRAHRVSYLLHHGGLPDGFVLDHLCRNRACVNPDHLEPVTDAENKRRGAEARLGARCKNGHRRTEENTYRNGSHHECRVCHRDRQRARRAYG